MHVSILTQRNAEESEVKCTEHADSAAVVPLGFPAFLVQAMSLSALNPDAETDTDSGTALHAIK